MTLAASLIRILSQTARIVYQKGGAFCFYWAHRTEVNVRANIKTKVRITRWQETDVGRRGFFQGYAAAEKDAINRARDRVGYIVANVRSMILSGKSESEIFAFLNKIEVRHATR